MMSAISCVLFKLRPFSSAKMQSSAKYFCHGSLFPGTTASKSSWLRRTSSSCVIAAGSPQTARSERKEKRIKGKTRISGRIFMLGNLSTCSATTNGNLYGRGMRFLIDLLIKGPIGHRTSSKQLSRCATVSSVSSPILERRKVLPRIFP